MRILVVQESNWIDRGPHQSHHLMERLVKRGHEVRVIDYDILWRTRAERKIFSPRSVQSASPKVIPGATITVFRPAIIQLPVLEYLSLLYTHRKEIARQFDEYKPDIVIGFGILNANLAISICHKKGIPFVYYCIDELHRLVPQPYFRIIAEYIERRNFRTADFVLSINEGLRDYTIEMGALQEKTRVIRAGVDLEWLSHSDRNKKRDELGFIDTDVVLLFMGWLYDFSGLKEVAESLSHQKTDSKLKLLVVGDGDLRDHLQSMKKLPGMVGRIIMVGWQPYDSIPDYIAAADICLLPAQKNEIMKHIVPIKMYEYMAAGKPVIATDLKGVVKEFGTNNGVVYIEKPEEALLKANALITGNLIRELGMNARHFVEHSDWNIITDCFEKTLETVIHDK